MELKLPAIIGTRRLPDLYALCGEVLRSDDPEIILDASEVGFIDPHGLAVLGALLSPMKERRIAMPWLSVDHAGYLDRMDFFKHCEISDVEIPDWKRYDHPERLVELTCITDAGETESVANKLADAITGQLTDADPREPWNPDTGKNQYDRYRHPIWYSLSELLENAVTHARLHGRAKANVWVAAQFYQKNNEVKLSVVDNGCGFLSTLRGHPELKDWTHMAAIRTALKPMVSCNRDSPYDLGHGNQGVGLTTTMKIANAARGRLMIASGNAYVETGKMKGSLLTNDGQWDGVAIAFSCRRHALPAVNLHNLLPRTEGVDPLTLTFID
jgi:hypothetical protein